MINKWWFQIPKKRNLLPKRHLVYSKWVLKKNMIQDTSSGMGYTQIIGFVLTDKYSQVVSVFTLYIILLLWLINKFYYQATDVETIF